VTRRGKVATMLVVGAVAATAGSGTFAAFVATSQNNGDRIESGSVSIGDNDNDAAVLTLSNVEPGASDSGCIKVSFTGSLDSTVRLYGTTTGTGLDQYVDLKVTRGVYTPTDPSFDSCNNFQADSTDYIGQGAGVVYKGTVQGFPDNYAGGVVDPPSGGPETWTTNETHVYKLEVQLRHNLSAQGLNATQSFTWEARNQ
jgi:hypothetical protein